MVKIKRNNKILTSFVAIALLVSSGVFVKYEEYVLANYNEEPSNEETKSNSPFPGVTINAKAEVDLNGWLTTAVGNNELFAHHATSGLVGGDTASIDNALSGVRDLFNEDSANTNGVLKPGAELPTTKEIGGDDVWVPGVKEWVDWVKSETHTGSWDGIIPVTHSDYWLKDTKTATAQGREKEEKILIPTRAFMKADNTRNDQIIEINGMYKNTSEPEKNGMKFINRKVNLAGNFANTNKDPLQFEDFLQSQGYHFDILGTETLAYGKTLLVDTDYAGRPGDPSMFEKYPWAVGDDDTIESRRMLLYSTPDCKPEEQRTINHAFGNGSTPMMPEVFIYNVNDKTFSIPKEGDILPVGTILVYFHFPRDEQHKKQASVWYQTSLENSDGVRFVSGKLDQEDGYLDFAKPDPNSYPELYSDGVAMLYHKTLKEYLIYPPYFPRNTTITSELAYFPVPTNVTGKNLNADTKVVRPKLTLDTNNIAFARDRNSEIISNNSKLGAMPTSELLALSAYKLVVKTDSLGVNSIAKDSPGVIASGNSNEQDTTKFIAAVTEDNVISVSPGTTTITIPVTTKGGNKITATSKNKSETAVYGVVGDSDGQKGSVTINIGDLMDTSEKTSAENPEKEIILFNEQQNNGVIKQQNKKLGQSDEISSEGQKITIKVENSQTIDFTEDTKTMISNTSYKYGEEFTIEAMLKEKGVGNIADINTPITFVTNTEYLEEVQNSSTWDSATLTQTAKFRVMKPQKTGTDADADDVVKITINRGESTTHNAAPPVTSQKVKTERKSVYFKIYESAFVSPPPSDAIPTLGKRRLRLTVGESANDISTSFGVNDLVTTNPDEIINNDRGAGRIPYKLATQHWLGDYSANLAMDTIPSAGNKILNAANGNIWKIKFVATGSTQWFDARYSVDRFQHDESIADVFDVSGNKNSTSDEVLFANNIKMTLGSYNTTLENLSTENKKKKLADLGKFVVTNNEAPYEQRAQDYSNADTTLNIVGEDSHAGTYSLETKLASGSALDTIFNIVDYLNSSGNINTLDAEQIWANDAIISIDEANEALGTSGQLNKYKTWAQVGAENLYTKAELTNYVLSANNVEAKIGEYNITLKSPSGATVSPKISVRDNLTQTDKVRVSANNLMLSTTEATELVKKLAEKPSIKDKIAILTPTQSTSKFGMYPKAVNEDTGNRVEITGITGLPEAPLTEGEEVKNGSYEVLFTTGAGAEVKAKISVYASDPTAYVQIPKKIRLRQSTKENQVAASAITTISLQPGKENLLTELNRKITVETPKTFDVTGVNGTTPTKMSVNVFNQDETDMHNGLQPLVTFDKDTLEYNFKLIILTNKYDDAGEVIGKNKSEGVVYNGTMQFKIHFTLPLIPSNDGRVKFN